MAHTRGNQKKTKWQALKTLEKEGYIKSEGHDLYITDVMRAEEPK